MKPVSDIYSTLSGVLVGRHPELGVLVSAAGKIKIQQPNRQYKWTAGCVSDCGYYIVMINHKNYLTHRIIAETFLENPFNKPTVDHLDRDKLNNETENLRWATRSENQNNRKLSDQTRFGFRRQDNPHLHDKLRCKEWYYRKREDPQWVLAERERQRKIRERKKARQSA